MDNERIFDLLEKIYIDVQETKKVLGETREELKETRDELRETRDEVRKIEMKVDMLDRKVHQLAEIQQSHYEENKRDHMEIVEMLTDRVENVENALKLSNIKVIK